jgi:hypothetical protein
MLTAQSTAASNRRFWIIVAVAAAAAFGLGSLLGRIRTTQQWFKGRSSSDR